jgi:hypothetical protein
MTRNQRRRSRTRHRADMAHRSAVARRLRTVYDYVRECLRQGVVVAFAGDFWCYTTSPTATRWLGLPVAVAYPRAGEPYLHLWRHAFDRDLQEERLRLPPLPRPYEESA